MQEMLAHSPAFPYDPTVGLYQVCQPRFPQPVEYGGWQEESMAWKNACAIFAGIYPVQRIARVTGPDVVELFSWATTSTYDKFPVGKLKHTILCDDDGLILTHGIVARIAEREFHTYTLAPWLNFAAAQRKLNVTFEDRTLAEFNFQCTGPRVLEALEHATGDCLHDIPFMGHRTSAINGKEVRLFRMGMAGTLGYEVHGPIEHAHEIYTKILEAGKPFGMQRMGWLAYSAQLSEGGFPQQTATFYGTGTRDPGFLDYLRGLGMRTDIWPGRPFFVGSSGPDLTKRYRSPFEVGWHRSVSFAHEFRGKAALQKEAETPRRRMVTLLWNVEDLMDVFGSLFRKGDAPYALLDFPIDPVFRTAAAGVRQYQDDVFHGDQLVGYANGRMYSLHSRDMTSMGCIDARYTALGTELTILWGEPGTRQKKIRATVAPYPHLALPSNSTFDVASIACIRKAKP